MVIEGNVGYEGVAPGVSLGQVSYCGGDLKFSNGVRLNGGRGRRALFGN